MTATRNPRAHTVARRWRIPPPLRGDVGFNGPEGMAVLEEIGGLLGSLVWGTLRSVTAWVETPVEDRPGMFPEDAARRRMAEVLEASPPASIEGALTDLAQLLEQPADVDPAAVGVACTRIARWADDRAYPYTAAQFFQVAANTCLTNPEYALAAARAARDLADYSRAEVWLQRAVGLSRQAARWDLYTKSFLSYGTMFRRRGNLPAARRAAERARRRAARHGLQHLQAAASHDLLVVASTSGKLDEAEAHARDAMRLYPADESRLHTLAHDVGCLWIKTGDIDGALLLFRASLRSSSDAFRPFVAGSMALAAGIAGAHDDFFAAKAAIDKLEPGPGHSEAWSEIGEGALRLGFVDVAEEAVAKASAIATARREHRIEFTVDDLRARIDEARRSAPTFGQKQSSTDVSEEPVVQDFVRTLQPA
jgi:tetratricopeptide (TPR) repeat protein